MKPSEVAKPLMPETIGRPLIPVDEAKHTPHISPKKLNPRVAEAEQSMGKSGVDTPWEASHQSTKPGSSVPWTAHHANAHGLAGQTDWEHKGAKRGGDNGPDQRRDPWIGMNTNDGTDQNQSYPQ